ncbi:MAG: fimbrial protein [Enterobacteriaceae bacterium]|jgi:hypothetical protein|nr:fimbrial protein [Enterobacteriaceae bacterium]
MKIVFSVLLLVACSQPAFAAPRDNLRGAIPSSIHAAGVPQEIVQQGIAPPVDNRCKISASSPVIDYGTQSRWQLQDVAGNKNEVSTGKRTLMLSVICPYTQTMRLMVRGERAANGDLRHGMKGNIKIRLTDPQLDGKAIQITATMPDGVLTGGAESILLLQPNKGFAPTQNGQLAKGKTFTARLDIEPVMPESAARISSHQTTETQLTVELLD